MASQPGSMGEPQYQDDIAQMQAMGLQRLGVHATWAYHDDPKRLLFTMARYKFVAKMIEGAGHALEIGCSDGFFTRVVRQSVDAVTAVDFDPSFIASARETMSDRWPVDFRLHDLRTGPVEGPAGGFDAVYSLDVLEHINAGAEEELFLANAIAPLAATGTCIIGMPSLQSQAYASAHSKLGHVNCKDQRDFKRLMRRYFTNVYMFSMNDEVVHTGYHAMAHYLIALCCGKKEAPDAPA